MISLFDGLLIAAYLVTCVFPIFKALSLYRKLITVQNDYPEQFDIEYVPEEDPDNNVVQLRPVNPFRLLSAEFLALESHLEKTDFYTYNRIRNHLMKKARIMLGVRD